ncbi:MAG: hypothetical protein FWH37_09795 [Candidatus Bathyarchaeota archaeon]|nr:hypothetical protein [Candidatus Termiticorpusculum sp.]
MTSTPNNKEHLDNIIQNNSVKVTPEKPKNIKEYLGNLAQDTPEKVISEIKLI